jgi:DNA-binding NarL/FixJ family response regulator
MLRILVATARPEIMHPFSEALSADPRVRLQHVVSGAEALDAVRASAPDLVVIDLDLPDFKPLDLVSQLLMVNAMVNTAVVSPLSESEFHEASEGLGVLGGLPVEPGRSDAADLLEKLRKVLEQTQ